ncbi:hypothetical protein J7E81_01395 [Bacillus sp. ISL-18]|uniref:hypothetical protein n=1 Tax=Bacillus sp. ISL-18 TaxID=2819118 RepID=UPI001BE83D5A|nr:hypothetical protein [Bacillus sp. ISL-18]MBT2653900.1 hypothetical protein [Bacillus sp. ISL-18]
MGVTINQKGKITTLTYKRPDGMYEAVLSDHKQKKTVKRKGLTEEAALQSAREEIKN